MRGAVDELTLDGHEWAVVSYAPARPSALAILTGSEMEVIDRWLSGRSMRSIASERGVTPRTIAKQISSAYSKLGVSSRAELLSLVHDLVADERARRGPIAPGV